MQSKIAYKKPIEVFKISYQFVQTAQENQSKTFRSPKELNEENIPKIVRREMEKYSRTLAKNYEITYVITKIENNRCYQHTYIIFYVPAILITAKQLAMYTYEKKMHIYDLFTFLIKRASTIMKDSKQIPEEEFINYLAVAVNYAKDVGKVNEALKQFLEKYERRMRGVMPVYYDYFKMISQMEETLPQDATIKDAMEIIKKVQEGFDKYRSQDI